MILNKGRFDYPLWKILIQNLFEVMNCIAIAYLFVTIWFPNNLSSGTQHHKKFFKGYENITEFVS